MLEVSPRILAHRAGLEETILMYAKLGSINSTATEISLGDLVTTDVVHLRISEYAEIGDLSDSLFVYIEGQWHQGEPGQVEVLKIEPVEQFGALMNRDTLSRLTERIDWAVSIAS